ncbi:MAG: AIR synthase-related protein [Verrucomicrobiota bacterium]|nr:AIR synthase-related protein [Verrucomicrobiota bacterium]
MRECVEGEAEACRAFGTPVIGGNVSLYNESPAGAVDPTPTIAMVGLIAEEAHITRQFFKTAGDVIVLVGEIGDELGGSRLLKVCHGRKEGLPPRLDLEKEIAVQNAVRACIQAGLVRSAHDCSEGGLAVALAESCFNPEGLLGAVAQVSNLHSPAGKLETCAALFGEAQSRIIISTAPGEAERVQQKLSGLPHRILGHVGGSELRIRLGEDTDLRWPIADLHDLWFHAIARAVDGGSAAAPLPSL